MYRMVFIKIFCRLIAGIALSFCVSCMGFREFSVEILQPSAIPLPTGKHIALLDRNIWLKDSVINLNQEDFKELQRESFNQYYRGMSYIAAENGFSDTIIRIPQPDMASFERGNRPSVLSADSVWRLCRNYNADYIVSIETTSFFAANKRQTLILERAVNLYSPLTDDLLDTVVQKGKFQPKEGAYIEFDDIIIDCWDQGADYAKRIIPCWKKEMRRVYTKGKVLYLGDSFFKENKYEQALQIWQSALKISSRTAIRAGINLAWLYESTGEFDAALNILEQTLQLVQEKSLKYKEVQYAQKYKQMLIQRIAQNPILELQITPVE